MKQNSVRLRIVRSELERLQNGDIIQETVRFGPEPAHALLYQLRVAAQAQPVAVSFSAHQGPAQIAVTLSSDQLKYWSQESQVGIYVTLPIDAGASLDLSIEKDFACLDRSDEENLDTFANPQAGMIC